jgi:outer membrane protein assembly factor BamB
MMLVAGTSGAAPVTRAQPSIFPLATRWSIEIGGPPVAGASPITDEHHVYVALRAGQIVAHDLADGQERWRKAVAAVHPLAVDAGMLFAATDEVIHAFRAEDGALAWEAPAATTAPLLAHAGWLIALAGGKVQAFRGSDGARLWERELGVAKERPAIEGDRLYVSLSDGRLIALNVSNGEQIWERRLPGAPQAPFVSGDRIYAGASDRQFYCLKAQNGEIDYQWRVGAAPQGSAAADASLIFVAALDNVLRAYARSNGNQRWQQPLKRRPATGPFVVGTSVLIASSSSAEIWAWTTKGKSAGTIATPAEPAVPPEFVDRGVNGAFVFVVTGGLTNQWRLTLLATAGDPPLQPLTALPGEALELKR